ncbi:hypothetical protein D9M71_626160 [compost metagenome]
MVTYRNPACCGSRLPNCDRRYPLSVDSIIAIATNGSRLNTEGGTCPSACPNSYRIGISRSASPHNISRCRPSHECRSQSSTGGRTRTNSRATTAILALALGSGEFTSHHPSLEGRVPDQTVNLVHDYSWPGR